METQKLPKVVGMPRAGFDLVMSDADPRSFPDFARSVAAAALATIECLDIAVFLVGEDMTVFHANRAAATLLHTREALAMVNFRLVCSQAVDTAKVRGMVQEAPNAMRGASGGVVIVRRSSGHRPLLLSIWPLSLPQSGTRPLAIRAIIFVSDVEKAEAASSAQLQQLYGLTAGETRVADALLRHERLADVAANLGVSLATVRTLLQRAFVKTDTHRQSELVRLMLAHQTPAYPFPAAAMPAARASSSRTSPPP